MNVTLTIETIEIPLTTPEQVLGDYIFTVSVLTDDVSSLYQRIDSVEPTALLTDVPIGSYIVTAQRFDVGGNAFGAQVAGAFTVENLVQTTSAPSFSSGTEEQNKTLFGYAAASLVVTLS
jgi:hypothetical protein